MSICRTTIMETHTKEDLDLMLADYIENFDSMFPECTLTLNSRINPTTLVIHSSQDKKLPANYKKYIYNSFKKLVLDGL